MKVEQITNYNLSEFKKYCIKHRSEVDESNLYDEDLEKFTADADNPTYLLWDDSNILRGVASLMIIPHINNTKKGRFRIFHSEIEDRKAYEILFEAFKPHIAGLDHLYLFVPEDIEHIHKVLKTIGFNIYRYSWVLIRAAIEAPKPQFPEGFTIRPIQFDKDEWAWCKVRNAAFASLAGNETPITEDRVKELEASFDYVDGGMLILWKDEEPVGVIRVGKEVENDIDYAFIGPLAVLPEYQGMGFGKNLLRAGLEFGRNVNMPNSMLVVNAENDRAADLYLKEGYTKQSVMICYKYDIMQ